MASIELTNEEVISYVGELSNDGSCPKLLNKVNLISTLCGVGLIIILVGALSYYVHVKS